MTLPGTVPDTLAGTIAIAAVLLAMGYGASPSRERAWCLGAAAFAVAITDPGHLALSFIAAVAAGAAAAPRARRAWVVLRPTLFALVGTGLGLAPMLIVAAARGVDAGVAFPTPVAFGPSGILVAVSALGAVVVLGRRLGKTTTNAAPLVVLALCVLAACAYDQATILLPVGPIMAIEAVRGRRATQQMGALRLGSSIAVSVGLCAGLALIVPPTAPQPAAASEHESAARELNRLLQGETAFTFTVIGPPTWTGRVVGTAYRADLAEFARRLTPVEAIDPGFSLPVPSKRVLVLTEKRPFATSFGGHPYDDQADRAALMTQVQQWLERYAQFHTGAETVYEDELIRIWSIDQARDAALSERFGMAQQ
jgi:hypothetical protein